MTLTLTPEQESLHIAELEKRGVTQVRSELEHGKISPRFAQLTSEWLSGKEREDKRRVEASQAEQTDFIRRTTEATECLAIQARRANFRATWAIVIAVLSMAMSGVGIWITHWDAHK